MSGAPGETITLDHGASRARLATAGGVLLGWHHHGQPLLRAAPPPMEPTAPEPTGSAGFPLVPYSNRIGHGRLDWAGRTYRLPANFPPEPHPIHGCGWQRSWTVCARAAASVTLAYHHQGDADWPWAFAARQVITLGDGVLTLALEATNLAPLAVPLGFGHHPYFEAEGARLRFAASGLWQPGADGLPERLVPPQGRFDFAAGGAVAGRVIDHGYQGWDGRAQIAWAGRRWALGLEASATLPCAVVYIPEGESYFCFEPVPHAINAQSLPGASPMPVIAPGGVFRARVVMRALEDAGAG